MCVSCEWHGGDWGLCAAGEGGDVQGVHDGVWDWGDDEQPEDQVQAVIQSAQADGCGWWREVGQGYFYFS